MEDNLSNSIDIARQALKQLALSKTPPTPGNYKRMYDDISGTSSHEDDHPSSAEHFHNDTAIIWRDLLIKTLEISLLSQLRHIPELKDKAEALLAQAGAANSLEEVEKLNHALSGFWQKLEASEVLTGQMHDALIQLFRLLIENMSQLSLGDESMHGQIQLVGAIIDKPLNLLVLQDAKEKLKALLSRQAALKHSLLEAKQALKNMATNCISVLAEMTASTGEYSAKIDQYQAQINTTEDIVELSSIIARLKEDTSGMQKNASRAFQNLKEAQEKVLEAERMIDQLTSELDQSSHMAYRDFLTGLLNRRGMEDALKREFDRAERSQKPMCLAMLDIDHFKKINDALGHKTGDEAIRHLSKIAQVALRVTDVLARYGGEEFLIILPETEINTGIHVLTRVQRELTKNLFLHQNDRMLITFSAGVTERKLGEDPDPVMKRIDAALYEAKHTGRNRVVGV